MTIKFTKMHGLGNDFMVINALNQPFTLQAPEIAALSRRDTGVGFDQCLIIEPSKESGVDFFYRIFNANGQEVGQCGNGARCLARFIQHYGLSEKKIISVATFSTQMELKLNEDETVTISLPPPKLAPKDIPLLSFTQQNIYPIPLQDGSSWPIHALNLGNPHAVSLVDNLNDLDIENLGQQISEHLLFPEQVNAGFMQKVDQHHLRLRVYERGCGETSACGSGAVAAAVVGQLYYGMATPIRISLTGGDLIVDWPDQNGAIYLTGPALFVYEGILMSCA